MHSLGDKRMESSSPFRVIKGGKPQFPQPSSKQFTEYAVGILIDCYELTHFVRESAPPDLSRLTKLGHFEWTPGTYFDSLSYRGHSIRFSPEGHLMSGPFLSESEWLYLIEQAWTDVVEAHAKKAAA